MDQLPQGFGHACLYEVHGYTGQVEAVEMEEALSLLRTAMGDWGPEKDLLALINHMTLVKALHRIPLAINLAAAEIRAELAAGADEREAILRYRTGLQRLQEDAQLIPGDHFGRLCQDEQTVWAAWQKCLTSSGLDVWPFELLILLSQFHRTTIRHDIFALASHEISIAQEHTGIDAPPWLLQLLRLKRGRWDDRSYRASVRCLSHAMLVTEAGDTMESIKLDGVARCRASHTEFDNHYQQLYLLVVAAACSRAMQKEHGVESRAHLLSYLPTTAQIAKVPGIDPAGTIWIYTMIGKVSMEEGHWKQSKDLFEAALQASREHSSDAHAETLSAKALVASALQGGGEYEQARKIYQDVLAGRRKLLGPNHPDVLTSEADLASVLQDLGEEHAAEKTYRRVLKKLEKVHGGEDTAETLVVVGDLASALQRQGKHAAALEQYERALMGSERTLGDGHPNTIALSNNIASALCEGGSYAAAEKMFLRVLEAYARALPPDHPDVLTTRNNLALAVYHQGRFGEAERACREAVGVMESVLGERHPLTLSCASHLALSLHALQRFAEAEASYRAVLGKYEGVLERDHRRVLETVGNLASLLEDQGNLAAWKRLREEYPAFVPDD